MSETNYKAKYMQLKAKFMGAVDTAFRLGYEQGAQAAQMDQMMQQQQQQAELEAQQAGIQPGAEGQQPGQEAPQQPTEEQAPDSQNPAGSELDQHIAKLEGMLGKSDISVDDLKKAVESMKDMKKAMQFEFEMKKSTAAIPHIAKALHRPAFKMGVQANANLTDTAKKAVSMQEKIVTDIFKAWENEGPKVTNSIADIINVEGLTKKE